jgi:hypothetical protein
MRAEITRTTPIYTTPATAGVFVQWLALETPTGSPVTFLLERSGSPEGPWETAVSGSTNYYFYDHEPISHLSLHRQVYYRVTATAGTVTAVSAPRLIGDNLPKRQRLLRKKIQRDIAVQFRVGSGIEFAIFKRRRWGTRCTVCFDALTKTVLNSKCLTCFGTGFVGGYFEPVRVLARKGVTNIQTEIAPQGVVEVNQTRFVVLDYPRLEPDDLVCEVRQDRRYVVKHATRTELQGVPVHQELVISELARDSIEYRLQVSTDSAPALF